MNLKSLSVRLKIVLIGIALCGLAAYGGVFPVLGRCIVLENPEFEYCFYPWLVLLWVTAIPCYCALFLGWRIACNIGKNCAFTLETAGLLHWISRLAVFDSALFLAANIVYLCLNMNHPGVVLLSLLVVFAGIAVAVVCSGLFDLVKRACQLQEQYDLTI